ncbi:FAD binding domain-containing protein [Falsigemmobacter faecalis]|uniref:Xanthine dehydrogenase family protein subunit M n=1 Tax=Falsigemmobacter faecalis TaxID=2488730 RepID=A0A3P3DJK9_9RHOB|nr:FAD binding domain-containing protein [Falsigemmobacter faecalis]RRH72808.1 xanthine dehydrogenase family protein subunit M [Falsigemmobacter faecalis]
MKPTLAGYARASTIAEATAWLAEADGDAKVIAGGQSLMAAINMGLGGDTRLIDINGIEALKGIRLEGDRLVIGALTRHAELGRHPLIAEHAPLLTRAVPLIAHEAIRTRGTIGGSLSHADPAAELPACVLALDALIRISGPGGEREVAADDFFEDVYVTDLAQDEIVTAISLPLAAAKEAQLIRELSRRAGDFALAGIALVRRPSGHRVAFFGTGPRPMLGRSVMAALDAGDLAAALAAVPEDIDPQSDPHASAAYRRHLASVLLRRCLEDLAA